MRKWIFIIVLIVVLTVFFVVFRFSTSLTVDNSTVQILDINRFTGRWYEIARFDHRFERNLTHCIAYYSVLPNGKIQVTNQGLKRGEWHASTGRVKMTNEPGVLRVSFFWPFYSDYRILMLDSEYTYALIGSDSDDYLWILSRTPQLQEDVREAILNEAERRGYDTRCLIWVKQDPD